MDRDQQLIVVAGGERLVDRIDSSRVEESARVGIDWHRGGVHDHADAARFTDSLQPVAQPVAEIDAGGCGLGPAEELPEADFGLGPEVPLS